MEKLKDEKDLFFLKKQVLEDVLSAQIDGWLDSLGYEADGGDAESESIKAVLKSLLFSYTGDK